MAAKSIAIEKLNHRLTGQDATFIYGESRNGPLHIGSFSFFEDETRSATTSCTVADNSGAICSRL